MGKGQNGIGTGWGLWWERVGFLLVNDHIWSSQYMTIKYDHYIWSSYMVIIYDDHIGWSYMIIIYAAATYVFAWTHKSFGEKCMGKRHAIVWKNRVCFKCYVKAVCKKTKQKYYQETKWTPPMNFWLKEKSPSNNYKTSSERMFRDIFVYMYELSESEQKIKGFRKWWDLTLAPLRNRAIRSPFAHLKNLKI